MANPLVALAAGAVAAGSLTLAVQRWAAEQGIPERAAESYARAVAAQPPGCNLALNQLAGFGAVESGHGSHGVSQIGPDGVVSPSIIGPRLDGVQFALIWDTDDGRWDGDPVYDRAVGPLQFIPTSWEAFGNGGNPNSYDDATAAATRYLCRYGPLDVPANWERAVLAYNHSVEYFAAVDARAVAYASGAPGVPQGAALASSARAPAEARQPTCLSEACAILDHAVAGGMSVWEFIGGVLHRGGSPKLAALWEEADRGVKAATTPAGAQSAQQNDPVVPSSRDGLVCPAAELGVVGEGWGAPRSWGGTHQGQDLLAVEGSPVVSPVAGVVVDVHDQDDNMLGLWVTVRAGNGDEWLMGHNQRNVVAVGDKVKAGQQVALIGQTGNAARDVDGPQVHVGYYPAGGQLADPSAVVAPCEAQLAVVEP